MTKQELKELIKEVISEGFFDDIDAANDSRRQQLKNNPPLDYTITTKKEKNRLNVCLTINDYNKLRYTDNGGMPTNKLDVIIQKRIEELVNDIADYNTRLPNKL